MRLGRTLAGVLAGITMCGAIAAFADAPPGPAPRPAAAPPQREPTPPGRVIIEGNEIAPPFVFALVDSAITVNGYAIEPRRPRRPTAERWSASTDTTRGSAIYRLEAGIRAGLARDSVTDCKECVDRAMRRVRASGLADTAFVLSECAIEIFWRGLRIPEIIDFAPPRAPVPFSLEDEKEAMRHYEDLVNARGGSLVIDRGVIVSVPAWAAAQLQAELRAIRAGHLLDSPDAILRPEMRATILHPRTITRIDSTETR